MPRTTIQLEDDAIKVAKAYARRHRMTLGQAVSDLVRKAAERSLATELRSGLRIVRFSRRSRKVTAKDVARLRDDIP
jgi:predicted DNA-binding ribbon-helix-helix protein